MNDSWNEDERLAAFLDGRLDARERAEMLSHLIVDDEAYEVFASLSAVLLQAEVEEASAAADGLTTPRERARPQRGRPRCDEARLGAVERTFSRGWMALAAVLAGVALVSSPSLRVRTPHTGDPVRIAAPVEHDSDGLPTGLKELRPWSSMR